MFCLRLSIVRMQIDLLSKIDLHYIEGTIIRGNGIADSSSNLGGS